MKKHCSSFLFALCFLISIQSVGQDSLKSPLKISTHLGYELTNVGCYGSFGGQINYKKMGFGLSYIVDYSDTELPFNGPFGVATTFSYSPNYFEDRIINHFIHLDYRITLHKRFCTANCSQKYNTIQELNIGYGLSIKIFKRLFISNTINIGWYFEKSLSERTNKKISESGSNSLINAKLNYLISR